MDRGGNLPDISSVVRTGLGERIDRNVEGHHRLVVGTGIGDTIDRYVGLSDITD